MIAALALAAAVPAPVAVPGCAEGLCNVRAIRPFLDKLADAERVEGQRPLHILQIGDSHTAGDTLTGGWRDILQARHGGGGRGVLAPGRPYQGYLTRGITAEMSPGWKIASDFGAASGGATPIGLAGFSLTSTADGARMALTADAGQMFDRFAICALAAPGAGTLSILVGGATEAIALDSGIAHPMCKTYRLDHPQFQVSVTAMGPPVTITSWATFRDTGGVALSNVGVVGSQLVHFARTDDAVIAEEMRAYRPDLIVLAFGTNEGFAPVLRPSEYEIVLRTQIGRLRRLSGGAPMLLLGAPDASSRRPEMLRNAEGPTPPSCPEPAGAAPAARPMPPMPPPASGLADVIAGLDIPEPAAPLTPTPVAAPAPAPAPWRIRANPLFPPAGLAAVREVQRRVAASLGFAFWDWSARMGGPCAAVRWVKADPPMMRGDYVHFTSAGGREIAARLEADIERAAAAAR